MYPVRLHVVREAGGAADSGNEDDLLLRHLQLGHERLERTQDALRYCHCASCKKLSGGAATVNGRVPSSSIRILEGEDLLQTYQPREGSAKTFCLSCGSNLFGGGWPESETCSVRATTFDEPF